MEIFQPSWRGRSISSRKDSNGRKYTAMVGPKSLLYIPVNVLPNAVYKVTLELCRESGNGVVYCNLYGNRNFDFHHSKVVCESGNWTTFDVDVVTKDFPKTVPIVFRMWRGKEGSGTVLVRRIVVQLEEGPVENIRTTGHVISVDEPGPRPPNPAMVEPMAPKPPQQPATNKNKGKPLKQRRPRKPRPNAKYANIECFKHHNTVLGAKRVLYLPANNTQIFQTGMYDAFMANGFELYTFDFRNFHAKQGLSVGEAFLKVCREFKPDWIHMQLQFTGMMPPTFIHAARTELPNVKITNWTGDIRSEAKQYFIDIGKQVDLALISSEGQVQLYKENGCPNVEYWQIGVDPKAFHPLSDEERDRLHRKYGHEIVFCAIKSSHFPDSNLRHRTVQILNKNFGKRFAIYGDGWGRFSSARGRVDYYGQNQVYNGAKIAINVNHFNKVSMYFSDRQLITMASGTPVICHYIPGLERYFENRKDLAWFHNVDECVQLVSYYLSNPEEAEKMGKRGAQKVLEQHSYTTRVKELAMRIGMIQSSDESMVTLRRIKTRRRPLKVLGVLSHSPDKRFTHRTTSGDIEFQGAFISQNIRQVAAEFNPDVIHFYVNNKRDAELALELRKMIEHATITCFFDDITPSDIDDLDAFDYIISNDVPEELEDNYRPQIMSMGDIKIQNKQRSDMLEEVLFIMGEI